MNLGRSAGAASAHQAHCLLTWRKTNRCILSLLVPQVIFLEVDFGVSTINCMLISSITRNSSIVLYAVHTAIW